MPRLGILIGAEQTKGRNWYLTRESCFHDLRSASLLNCKAKHDVADEFLSALLPLVELFMGCAVVIPQNFDIFNPELVVLRVSADLFNLDKRSLLAWGIGEVGQFSLHLMLVIPRRSWAEFGGQAHSTLCFFHPYLDVGRLNTLYWVDWRLLIACHTKYF